MTKKSFPFIIYILAACFVTKGILISNDIYINKNFNSAVKVNAANKNIIIVVDVTTNVLSVFVDGKVLKTYPVAGGKPSTPSPIGTWKIVSKGRWNEGFGGHWMGINVPWGKYGIHGTIYQNSIGSNSSHGCIRMHNKDVAELYKITPYGTPVIIWGGPYGNFGSYLRTVKPGDRGADVYEVQKVLKDKGYYNGNPDGIYGEWMKSVIHKYQKDHKLAINDNINMKIYESLGIYLIE